MSQSPASPGRTNGSFTHQRDELSRGPHASPPEVIRCHHCDELCDESIVVPVAGASSGISNATSGDQQSAEKTLSFCCSGCVAAWHILQGRELPDFVHAPNDREMDTRLKAFDLPEIAREYLQARERTAVNSRYSDANVSGSSTNESSSETGGLRLELDIQGIHCQSCVTVCERSLERLPEVEGVAVDYETGRARIDFTPRTGATDGAAQAPAYISRAIRQLRLVGYDGVPLKPGRKTEALRNEGRSLLWKIVLSGFAAGNTMMLSIALWSGYFDGSLPIEYKRLFEWMQFLLTTPIYLYAARVFHRGWRGLFQTGTIGMDVLISAGISAAYFYSVFVFMRPLLAAGDFLYTAGALMPGLPTAEVYFDSVTMIVFLLLVGRYLEWRARLRQRERMESLLRPLPDFCFRLTPGKHPGAEAASDPSDAAPAQSISQMIAVSELKAGDLVLLRPGETVPADGVLTGAVACDVDEAVLTGEARAVVRAPGDRLLAGSRLTSISSSGGDHTSSGDSATAILQITAAPYDSSLGILARMTDATGNRRSQIERSTGRLVPWFGLAVLVVATASFLYFYIIAGAGLEQALLAAVSVLIVSCPCALALSVPTAAGAALFMGLRAGVLFRDGRVLEEVDSIRNFYFDKTGTLTTGRPRVIASRFYAGSKNPKQSRENAIELIRVMETGTMHPIGLALLDFARQADADSNSRKTYDASGDISKLPNIQSIAGRGVYLPEADARIGSLSFLGLSAENERFKRELGVVDHATLVGVSRNGECLAVLALSDEPREDARATLDFLRDRNCRISILTGDQSQPALHLADQLGVNKDDVHASLLPAEKTEIIRENPEDVCMVGDGFNDAPALAAAQLSVVHALSAPLSLEQAGIVLLNNRLSELTSAIRIAGAARKVMRANLGFSLVYNAIMIPLAAAGLLLPIWCALFMALSSLTVIGSSALFRLSFRAHLAGQ